MKKPEKIDLNQKQADDLMNRLDGNCLTDRDRSILKLILNWYFWLQMALQESKISISRIKSMFGFPKTESKQNLETNQAPELQEPVSQDEKALSDPESLDSDDSLESPQTSDVANQNADEESDSLKKKGKAMAV